MTRKDKDELLREQKETNELLQTIASSVERKSINLNHHDNINKLSEEIDKTIPNIRSHM
ncbi:hypothetical protein ACPTGJ_05035 [Enterococcus faecalis]|uniref:hypothetical protein n=1 Tax=Enterococcus faecalis TaxID=1351 RepID=UPI003CC563DF